METDFEPMRLERKIKLECDIYPLLKQFYS